MGMDEVLLLSSGSFVPKFWEMIKLQF